MSMEKFLLSQEEVKEFTGASHKSRQVEFLSRVGIDHEINLCGKVIVLRDSVRNHFGGGPRHGSGPRPKTKKLKF